MLPKPTEELMLTIHFEIEADGPTFISIDVQGILAARILWDHLESKFQMISKRP